MQNQTVRASTIKANNSDKIEMHDFSEPKSAENAKCTAEIKPQRQESRKKTLLAPLRMSKSQIKSSILRIGQPTGVATPRQNG